VLFIKSITGILQILVMQYRRRFIHIHPFQVFSYMFRRSRYERYWLFRIIQTQICIVVSETNPWFTAYIVGPCYEMAQFIISTSWKRKIATPQAAPSDLGCRHVSVDLGGTF